jgi:hypothetical protein
MILVCPACRGIALGLHNEVLTLWVFFTNHFLKILSHKIERKLKLWQLRASLDLGEHFFGQGVNSSLHSWRFNWNRRLPPTLCTYLYLELDPMILSLNWNTESVKLINGSSGVLLWSSWNWNMRDPDPTWASSDTVELSFFWYCGAAEIFCGPTGMHRIWPDFVRNLVFSLSNVVQDFLQRCTW